MLANAHPLPNPGGMGEVMRRLVPVAGLLAAAIAGYLGVYRLGRWLDEPVQFSPRERDETGSGQRTPARDTA
ncbi:hypothetical protein GCM10009533_25890 [Saccharopolyspora spinosporotrichia]|uniref:Secreted protein n=2 Tax=Saccharopolyspora erythraea TaxID=1836 RepID=A0ABN1CSV9_SACER